MRNYKDWDYTIPLIIMIFAIACIVSCSKPSIEHKPTDYQLNIGNDTITLLDSNVVVAKIPYSDSSDIWKLIIEDNR